MRDEQIVRDDLLGRASANDQALLLRMRSEDREFDEWCSLVESDLIDEYVLDQLSGGERDLFERWYLINDERRSKVAFARLVHSAHRRRALWQRAGVGLGAFVVIASLGFGAWSWIQVGRISDSTLKAELIPGIQRDRVGIQTLRVPSSARVLEIHVGVGRAAKLHLSGVPEPMLTWTPINNVVRIPVADLEETEYLLVVETGDHPREYNFRVVKTR